MNWSIAANLSCQVVKIQIKSYGVGEYHTILEKDSEQSKMVKPNAV